MFRGRHETTVDNKGRTSLPARFREVLAGQDEYRLIVTDSLDPCIIAYPYTGWRDFEKKLTEKSVFNPNVVRIRRLFISGAAECPLDGHGRILVPPLHRQHAGLSQKVVWCGMGDYIELWDAARFEEALHNARSDVDGLRMALTELGL
jgi:MraZ protein